MPTLEEQLGAAVRHHRLRAGLSQQELADRIGRTSVTVSRLENGKSATTFDSLGSLAKALDIEIRDLFGIGDFAARDDRDDPLARIFVRLSELDDTSLEWIERIVAAALSAKSSV